jgi:hypothetical protein
MRASPSHGSLAVFVFLTLSVPALTAAQDERDVPPGSTVPPHATATRQHEPVPEEGMQFGLPQPTSSTGPDVRVSGDGEALAEVLIDVNPTNPHNLVICGHSPSISYMATWYTFDAGASWHSVQVGAAQDHFGFEFRFDPALAFDADGNVYVAYGVTHPNGVTTVVVCKSTDGGRTYTQCAHVWDEQQFSDLPGNDKWALATGRDPVAAGRQNVYIAWTWNIPTAFNLDQQIAISRSTDGGATFSTPVVINDNSITGRDRGLFADPSVGPDGELYVSWHDFDNSARIMVDRSFDGGLTWGTDVVVSTFALPLDTPIPAQPDRGVSAGPVMDVDVSSGPHRGRAYITYCQPAGFGLDIMLRHSDDHAATWSAPVRVNDDVTLRDQFLPYLDVGRGDGTVSVVFYDAREDPLNQSVKTYAAVSRTGGESFEANQAVADASSNNSVTNRYRYGGNFLEYIGVATGDCAAYAVWTDIRGQDHFGGGSYYYFDRIRFDTTPPTLIGPADLTVECDGNGGLPVTDPRAVAFLNGCVVSDDCDPHPLVAPTLTLPETFFPGQWLIEFRALDSAGNSSVCNTYLNVIDPSPPELKVTLTPDVIWPPNHRMVDVHADVSLRDECAAPKGLSWFLVSVTPDEPADGPGDGSTSPDIAGVEPYTEDTDFSVRAERSGYGDDRRYRVVFHGSDSTYEVYDTLYVTVPHDREADSPSRENAGVAKPSVTALHDARPNPFNPATTISFDLARPEHVCLMISDVRGARVRTLVDENRPAGSQAVRWDGRDDGGASVASGLYFMRMQAGSYTDVRKLVLLK